MEAKVRDEILDRVMRVLVQDEGSRKVLSKKVKRIMLSKCYPNVKRIDLEGEEEVSNSSEEDEDSLSESEDALQIPISAEHQTSQQSFHEDPSSQYEHPRTPSPRHYLPDDCLPLKKPISSERPTLQHPPNPRPPHLPRKKTPKPLSKDTQPPSKKANKKPNTVTYVKMESPEEYKQNIRKRIDKVLKLASAGGTPITYQMYEKAVVEQPRKGSEVLLQRDIDEIFINNYNAEWITSWDANIDISPVYDYYGTITYITDYFTKVSSILWFRD